MLLIDSMTTAKKIAIKKQLHAACKELLMQRVNGIKNAIADAQQTANTETKSSSGDKYETTRAMMHLEIEKNTTQLLEANKQLLMLDQIKSERISCQIENGAVIVTNHGQFYLAVSAGKINLDTQSFMCISAASPIGQQFMKKEVGHTFIFQGRTYELHDIY